MSISLDDHERRIRSIDTDLNNINNKISILENRSSGCYWTFSTTAGNAREYKIPISLDKPTVSAVVDPNRQLYRRFIGLTGDFDRKATLSSDDVDYCRLRRVGSNIYVSIYSRIDSSNKKRCLCY